MYIEQRFYLTCPFEAQTVYVGGECKAVAIRIQPGVGVCTTLYGDKTGGLAFTIRQGLTS